MLTGIYKGVLKLLLITHLSNTKMEDSSWIGFCAKGTNPCLLNYAHNSWPENFVPMENWNRKSFPSSLPWLNQSERTDSISRAHDGFCQSHALEQTLAKAIICRDCKCLPKTRCWKMFWMYGTSDGNSVWAKLASHSALNFQGAPYWFSTFMRVHCENSKGI